MAKELTTALILRPYAVEWTTLQRDRGGGRVVDFQRRMLPDPPAAAASEPEEARGASDSVSAVSEEIEPLCRDLPGRLHVGLPAETLLLRVVALPHASAEELRGMVELQMDKISPFPVEDMVFSHEVLERGAELSRVLVVAARLNGLEDVGRLLKGAGVQAERLDAAMMGWWPLLHEIEAVPASGRHVHLMVHEGGSDMLVTLNGHPIAMRRLPEIGADADAQTWARDMVWEINHSLMALELEHGGEADDSMTVWHGGGQARAGATALHDLCENKPEQRSLEELPPLSEGLARRALRGDAGLLDLTPQRWRSDERRQRFRKRMKQAAAALAALWVAGMGLVFGGAMVQSRWVETLRLRQAEWAEPADQVRDMRERVRMIRRFAVTDHSAIECLREVARLLPDGVELTSFTYRKGEGIQIAGQAGTIDQVYEYQTRMDGSELFVRVSLSGPRLDTRRGQQVFDMDIDLPEDPS